MNDFEYDAMQKKRIARGDYNRKRQSKKCTLPSDYLTPGELNRRNGEVRQYNLSAPMSFAAFRSMPEDLQAEYLRKLRARFGVSDRHIAAMMGVSHPTIVKCRARLGVTIPAGTRLVPTTAQRSAWLEWIGVSETPKELPVDTRPKPTAVEPTKPKPDEAPRAKAPRLTGGRFTIEGEAQNAAAQLAELFRGDPRMATFELRFTFSSEVGAV